jgi:CheY-specific phosphatase CheX
MRRESRQPYTPIPERPFPSGQGEPRSPLAATTPTVAFVAVVRGGARASKHMKGNETTAETLGLMERHLVAATTALFDAYGIALTRSTHKGSDAQSAMEASVAATIGYTGDKVRGALVMLSSADAIRQWQLAIGGLDASVDLCDTLCEFSNMLLGRLKGHLLTEGMPILMSTPNATFGRGLSLGSWEGASARLAFDGPAWSLQVRLDAAFEQGFARTTVGEAPATAGDLILF